MYFPATAHVLPAAAGLPEAEEVPLTATDGVRIAAWHVPPRDGKPVILYFHGNGGALRFRVTRFRRVIADGIGLVALEYCGYGGLGGGAPVKKRGFRWGGGPPFLGRPLPPPHR